MARAATTSDAFNAVAEPRRRQILLHLMHEERSVGDIVVATGWEQPSVSKHLRVLRDVGLVRVRRNGKHMMYRTNAEAIRPHFITSLMASAGGTLPENSSSRWLVGPCAGCPFWSVS